eukprot:SAG31_NODE_38686_length_294_cov_0.794872_1_plen_58_part_01
MTPGFFSGMTALATDAISSAIGTMTGAQPPKTLDNLIDYVDTLDAPPSYEQLVSEGYD